jgi:hypothetical protein
MLFRVGAFKNLSTIGPVVNNPGNLYRLRVPRGLHQLKLTLKDEILDKFLFCQSSRQADRVKIALDKPLSSSTVRYRMRRGGEITGFEGIAKPYCLRYGAAKAFNESRECFIHCFQGYCC